MSLSARSTVWRLGTFAAALMGFVAGLFAITFIILRTRWLGTGDRLGPDAEDVLLSFLQVGVGAVMASVFAAWVGTEHSPDGTRSRTLPILIISALVAVAIAIVGVLAFLDSTWYLLVAIGLAATGTSLATWRLREPAR